MSFPRNTQFERLHAPRTLSEAFGPYAQLHVPPKRYNVRGWAWAIAYGAGIGIFWWLCVAVRAGMQ